MMRALLSSEFSTRCWPVRTRSRTPTGSIRRRMSGLIAHVGVWNALSLRNLTAPACFSRAIGWKITPCWPTCFCCELKPPTIAAT